MSTTPAALLSELATLRRANRLLVEKAARAGHDRTRQRVERMIDRALLDALALVTLHVGGGDVGRAVSPLPQRRWCYAVALLRLAGLASGRYVRLDLPEPEETVRRLERAAHAARVAPGRWARHMPVFARPLTLQAARRNVASLEGRMNGQHPPPAGNARST